VTTAEAPAGPAVLAGRWLGTPAGERVQLGEDWHLGDVSAAAAGFGCRVAYVLQAVDDVRLDWARGAGWTVDVIGDVEGVPFRLRVAQDGRPGVVVVLLDRDAGDESGPWKGQAPADLLAEFAAFTRFTGVAWGASVGSTAEAVILATHPRDKGGRRLDREPVTPGPVRARALEIPFVAWRRELTKGERAARYVHAYDAKAQYLGAWQSVELGFGNPVLVESPRFDASRYGFWRLDLAGLAPMGAPLLPAPWIPGREWFSTATVVRLLEVCDGLDVPSPAAAWLWPERSRWLRGAAELLDAARKRAAEDEQAARAELAALDDDAAATRALDRIVRAEVVGEAVKRLYAAESGRFGAAWRADTGSAWYRPDWMHAIRAQARVNLHRRLSKLAAAPFAIGVDAVLFASDEPDGLAFAESIGLRVGVGLGMFSHEASGPAGPVFAELDRGGKSVTALLRAIEVE